MLAMTNSLWFVNHLIVPITKFSNLDKDSFVIFVLRVYVEDPCSTVSHITKHLEMLNKLCPAHLYVQTHLQVQCASTISTIPEGDS